MELYDMEDLYDRTSLIGDGPRVKGMWHRIRRDDFSNFYAFLMSEDGILDVETIDLESVDAYLEIK